MKNEALVSIIMITYNHEKYIEEAINGVLMQKCDFDYELIIANDHSTDHTDAVIHRILKDHPKADDIKYINRDVNVGMVFNFIDSLNSCSGKYIAVCEGDDYWTEPSKLQKQVSFMESNKGYSMVCHDALVLNEINHTSHLFFSSIHKKQVCSTRDVFDIHFCPSASILFRKQALQNLPDLNSDIMGGDLLLVLLLSLEGLLYRMFEVMSVYRKTERGIAFINKSDIKKSINNRIGLLNYFNEVSNKKYAKYIQMEILLEKSYIDYLNSKSKIKKLLIKIYLKALNIQRKIVFSN